MIPAEAYMIPINVVVKAHSDSAGRRIVEVEASSEEVDAEGDVVLQKALLNSAPAFIRSGHLDLDHLSEIGHRLGIADPTSYIIGRPIEVKDLGNRRTGVVGEIMRANSGVEDTNKNRFDAFWKSLQSEPPVMWRSSIYGYPTDLDDCTEAGPIAGATRYVIKEIDWRSLAFTRNPINTSLKGYARMVKAASFVAEMAKRRKTGPPEAFPMPCCMGPVPTSMDALLGNYMRSKDACPHLEHGNSTLALKDHLMFCCGADPTSADILAHALMFYLLKQRKRASESR